MKKRAKVYLPRWMRWFVIALLGAIWTLLLRATFFVPPGAEALGPSEFGVATVVLLLVAVVIWLGSGRLPMYVVEIEDVEDRDERPPRR